MYLILWLFLNDTSQASPGILPVQPQGAMYLIVKLLLKDTSQASPGTPQASPRGRIRPSIPESCPSTMARGCMGGTRIP